MFANTKTDRSNLPPGTKQVRSKAGNTIPMVFVTTADGSKGIQGISYDTLKKGTRDANRDLRKMLKENPELLGNAAPAEEKKSGHLAESQEWTNTDGNKIVAAVHKVEGTMVHFLMNGRMVKYPLEKLSKESQDRITALNQ